MNNESARPIIRHCFVHTDHWLVEMLVGEDIESATFHGANAEHRAKEYFQWKYASNNAKNCQLSTL